MRNLRVGLIGGTSNVGKSTLAQALASRFGWACVSTDSLGRHPGRPWKIDGRPIPAHVPEHYLSLPVPDLATEQLRHYERMWPAIQSLIYAHVREDRADRLILEGSGVWPDRVAELKTARIASIWLTASRQTLRARIYSASGYAELSGGERILVDRFLGRTERYNEIMLDAARRLALPLVDVDSASSLDGLVDRCIQLFAPY